ncbi:hypothetical protein M885DRAFT_512110 [Pelagophyceae sp. CCMP2097]|nr:hypothetical protein M885DRAFT_512110 [Pelagophyceae sp. CCMP2097]
MRGTPISLALRAADDEYFNGAAAGRDGAKAIDTASATQASRAGGPTRPDGAMPDGSAGAQSSRPPPEALPLDFDESGESPYLSDVPYDVRPVHLAVRVRDEVVLALARLELSLEAVAHAVAAAAREHEAKLSRLLAVALALAVATSLYVTTLLVLAALVCCDSRLLDALTSLSEDAWRRFAPPPRRRTLSSHGGSRSPGAADAALPSRDDGPEDSAADDGAADVVSGRASPQPSGGPRSPAVDRPARAVGGFRMRAGVAPRGAHHGRRRHRTGGPPKPRGFSGRWRYDRDGSDAQEEQLKVLGVPWAARMALARSSMTKRIVHDGVRWIEATTTAVITKTQTISLDGTIMAEVHPIDHSEVKCWHAVGGLPRDAPTPDKAVETPPPSSVVSVFLYTKTGNQSVITRTLEDAGETYHVVNHLVVGSTRQQIITHSYFRREPEDHG